ncbi:MAG: gamma-glutamylcyclotransferase family protein [Bauldia sp.]
MTTELAGLAAGASSASDAPLDEPSALERTPYLFVYGTLRRGSGRAESRLLERTALYCGGATFQGRLFRAEHYAAAIPSADPADRVEGDLYRLPANGELLDALDAYEECGPDFPAPTLFCRARGAVSSHHHGTLEAWVYLYNRDTAILERISAGDFLAA